MIYEDYKNLHKIPELGFKEFKTSAYILNRIKNTKAIINTINTGVCAFFDFKKEKTIAFRAELDALKIKEKNNVQFKSMNNNMHACGHDGHMAILLNLIDIVNTFLDYPYNILFVFQPSEEKIGGALSLLPFLRHFNYFAFLGMHVFPYLEEGKIYTSKKEIFASATEIDVIIKNQSVHIANYNKKYDAINLAFNIIRRLEYVAKKEGVLLHFGKIKGGKQRNATASNCVINGSLRCLNNEKSMHFINNYLINTKSITYKKSKTIPALKNNYNLAETMINNLNVLELTSPFFQAEDFSFYNNFNPCFFLLGTKNKSPLHNNQFILYRSDLTNGLSFYLKLLDYFLLNNR